MRLKISVNGDVLDDAEQFIEERRSYVVSYSRELPGVPCVRKLMSRDFAFKDIVRYIVFVGVND